MPKEKESVAGFLSRMAAEYPNVFRNDNSVLFCTYCNQQVTGTKLFNVKQHISTLKHKRLQTIEEKQPQILKLCSLNVSSTKKSIR